MISSSLAIDSKLPWVGTTIFTVMSKLATDCGAINLSQGFPDFQADPALFEAAHKAMSAGRNQYPPMAGMPELRSAIAGKVESLYGVRYDQDQEITVTAGATQGLFTAIAAFVRGGDEVIVFAPFYDSYVPAIETVGGRAVYASLQFPDYKPDWNQVRSLITPRTRMIIVNSPNNPTGTPLGLDVIEAAYALSALPVEHQSPICADIVTMLNRWQKTLSSFPTELRELAGSVNGPARMAEAIRQAPLCDNVVLGRACYPMTLIASPAATAG